VPAPRKTFARLAGLLSGLLLTAACTSGKPPTDFLDEDLTGKLAGKEWSFIYGFVDPTIDTPEEDDMVIILLPFQPKDRCPKPGSLGAGVRLVMVSAPMVKKLTRLKAGSNRNAVFQYLAPGKKQTATAVKAGKVKLDNISETLVEGRLFAKHSDTNWVSGRFSAQICEYSDFQ
jgi:hypothetical protein